MKSKYLAFGLSALLALSLVSCGGQQTQEPQEPKQETQQTEPVTKPAESTPSSGNSVTDDFLKTITAETAEAKGVCGADLTWYYQDGVLVIKGTGPMTDYTYDTAKSIPWLDYRDKIGWIIIQEGVTSIGSLAFSECRTLSSIELPETIEVINGSAFSN